MKEYNKEAYWRNRIDFSLMEKPDYNPEHRMSHNIYFEPDISNTSGRFQGFMIDFKADYAPKGTYWSLCTWKMDLSSLEKENTCVCGGDAYAGLQNTEDGPVAIMSFWNIEFRNKNGEKEIKKIHRVYPEGGDSYFSNEGEGVNYIKPFNWKEGCWYQMILQCTEGNNNNTFVEMYIKNIQTCQLSLICKFDTGLKDSSISGDIYQFMENYDSDYCNEVRSMQIKNICVREKGDHRFWVPITAADLSIDTCYDNKKGQFNYGVDNSIFWGITNGYGDDTAKYKTEAKRTYYAKHNCP